MRFAIGCYKFKGDFKIFPGEFGHSKYFIILNIENPKEIKVIENPYADKELPSKFKLLAELLKEVDFFVGYEFGDKTKKLYEIFGKKVIKVPFKSLDEVIEILKKNLEKFKEDRAIIDLRE